MWPSPLQKSNLRRKVDVSETASRGDAGRCFRYGALFLAGLLILSGCEGLEERGQLEPMSSKTVARTSFHKLPRKTPDNVASGTKIVHVVPRFSKVERNPIRLLKMGEGKLNQILGPPGFVRREASARVWQYRTTSCVLNLYLYNDKDVLRVIYYEFHPVRGASVSNRDCFETLLARAVDSVKS